MAIMTNFERIEELKDRLKRVEDRLVFLENFVEMDFRLNDK